MKNSQQVKDLIHNLSRETNIRSEVLLRFYLNERFLERVSLSKYMTYNLETVIAEKYETIISRNILNTRMRDFYDICILYKLKKDEINQGSLKSAVYNVFKNRNSLYLLPDIHRIINEIKNSTYLIQLWNTYKDRYEFAKEIYWEEIFEIVEVITSIVI